MKKYLPLDIDQSIESKIRNVEFRWKSSDNVVADLTGESPFWIIRREKLDKLILDEALKYGSEILIPSVVEKISKKNNKWIIKNKVGKIVDLSNPMYKPGLHPLGVCTSHDFTNAKQFEDFIQDRAVVGTVLER